MDSNTRLDLDNTDTELTVIRTKQTTKSTLRLELQTGLSIIGVEITVLELDSLFVLFNIRHSLHSGQTMTNLSVDKTNCGNGEQYIAQ